MTPRTPREEAVAEEAIEAVAAVEEAIETEVEVQMEGDRGNRIARTAVQTSIPAAIVGIFEWQAALHKIDLDPGAGIGLPGAVAGYFVSILTVVGAVVMNRPSSG